MNCSVVLLKIEIKLCQKSYDWKCKIVISTSSVNKSLMQIKIQLNFPLFIHHANTNVFNQEENKKHVVPSSVQHGKK